jgi:segregation and condensation protein B
MTRKKKTKPQTDPETEPTELTPEVSGQPGQPETLPTAPPPEPADQTDVEAEAMATPGNGNEAETPRDEAPAAVIETIETETDEIVGDDTLEEFDGEEDSSEPEPSGAEIVSVSFDSPVAPSEEEPATATPPEEAETSEDVDGTGPEDETPVVESPSEPIAEPQPSEVEASEAETGETVEAESETGEVRSEEEETPAPPTDAEVQALDFQAAFRRAFQQPDEEQLEAEPSEIEQETADVEDISGEPLARTPAQIKAAVECLLFTTPSPLGARRMANIIGGIDLRTMRGILGQLQAEYDARGCGIQIIESAEGFQMCTRPEYATAVMQLHRQRKKNPLSPTALETLAIVAYKQPLTRAEIEMIRGVECSGVVRNLCDLDLIKVVGRKEVIGRPQLYGTTARFLQTFGLKSIEELPSIQNLRRRYALDDDESKPTSVQDLIQAQANRAALGAADAESQPAETQSERQESEEAGTNASGETPMPQNRPPLDDEEDSDLREDQGDDASEETGDTSDAPEEDIPEEDEAEMDEAEETFIADEDDEADEDEGWDDGKDDEEEEDDAEANDDREDADEEADGADTDTPEETDEDDSEGDEDDMNDRDDEEEEDDEEEWDEEEEDEDDEDWDEDEDDEDEEEDEEEDDD